MNLSGNCFNVNLGYDFITDMLVLEFTIDVRIIDARRNDNPWLNRAAQSLAEALRLWQVKSSMLKRREQGNRRADF